MYGLIGKMRAPTGQRDSLIGIPLDGVSGTPGRLGFLVARDSADADSLWITEARDRAASHEASLRCRAPS